MPLTQFQKDVFKIISRNRNPDSYVAGGIVIHREETSSRYSDDIDLFHDTSQAVIASAQLDSEALEKAGYTVSFLIREPTFHQATITYEKEGLRLDWAADSAIVQDEMLGFRLHDADAATNKVLAAAGRDKVRDFIDLMQLDRTYTSLGVAVWAAAGKDEGYTPAFLIDQMRRHCRINPATLGNVVLASPADAVALKKEWLACLEAAETLISSIPSAPLGCLYLDQAGQPGRGTTFDPTWVPHFGSVKGAWPKMVD